MLAIKPTVEAVLVTSRGRTREYLRELREGQWLDPPIARADQERRLRALLEHASRHVPYYRTVFKDHGLDSGADGLLERFGRLPLLDKGTLREHFEELKSDDLSARKWEYDSTSGSTGEPVRLIHDSDYADHGRAWRIIAGEILCHRPGDRKLVIWGSVRDLLAGKEKLRTRFLQWLRNEVWLNSFNLTPDVMRSYVEIMNRYRPDHVMAYVESIVEIARFIERNGLAVHSPGTVSTAAGRLEPHMRELLARVFRADVFDWYGSREVFGMAIECDRHEGLHVPLQNVLIEIVREDGSPAGPGEVGRIVVTSLINCAMPLIRYDVGDLGAWAGSPCSCGRSWPLLSEITGRISDTFRRADGTLVAGQYFNYAFYLQDWVDRFQVVQESTTHVRARIVTRGDLPDLDALKAAGMAEIVEKVRLALGEDCQVSFEFVDELEPSASGKYRFTVSKVHPGDQDPPSPEHGVSSATD
jgi:phenylacetate-CoA ligase